MNNNTKTKFFVELIKPSHYDDDGYVIQWRKSWIPSNTLACINGLAQDAAEQSSLGSDVEFVINAYDEMNIVIPVADIIRRFKNGGGHGVVFFVGVQSNQFPRAIDIARQFREENMQVVIGGFHTSGCIAMLTQLPEELREATEAGISLFAGEAEDGRLTDLLKDAYHKNMKSIYNYLDDLPGLEDQPMPVMPASVAERFVSKIGSFDAGRGCSFLCSFCTVINVQGRKSRYRNPDDVEKMIRSNLSNGINDFFLTDDNFARNKNWEAIFDRLINLRENQGFKHVKFTMQIDSLAHKIKNFISKAARAGCRRVFIGLESINPENLQAVNKRQNKITEYRKMFQAWRNARVVTVAGYILGFPADTPEKIEQDIKTIQQEIPVDLLEFFCLTPLPGSEDHKNNHLKGVWMDPDLNNYDLEHVTMSHSRMSKEEWEQIYRKAWDLYYSPEHIKTLIRRAAAGGPNPSRVMLHIHQFHGTIKYQNVHPLQGGFLRRKVRTQRRPGMPQENPITFYPRRARETVSGLVPFALYYFKLRSIRKRIKREPERRSYTDKALIPVNNTEDILLENENVMSQ
ncbi:MAG: B12-binding domain-containing radical SAM protein [Planctomycetota bacterium]|jgi:tRNA A37 methylthiotransferase MiaB